MSSAWFTLGSGSNCNELTLKLIVINISDASFYKYVVCSTTKKGYATATTLHRQLVDWVLEDYELTQTWGSRWFR